MGLQFVAMVNNQAKPLSEDELTQWILGKSDRYIAEGSARKCARAINDHSGTGGGIKHKLDGSISIFHDSNGKRNGNDGCTVFFATREGKHAVILGIGWHITDTSYRLDWKNGNWNQAGKMVVNL